MLTHYEVLFNIILTYAGDKKYKETDTINSSICPYGGQICLSP